MKINQLNQLKTEVITGMELPKGGIPADGRPIPSMNLMGEVNVSAWNWSSNSGESMLSCLIRRLKAYKFG